jgi:flagellar biosynthesis protein FlhG
MVAASLGLCLTERKQRVVMIDGDFGGANLHSCIGVAPPKVSLYDFVEKKAIDDSALIVRTGCGDLRLVSGAMDDVSMANPKYAQKLRLLREIASFDADYVIIDLGAGTTYNTLDFFLIADHGIVSVLPEPTSIENAYRFIKAAFFRRLKNLEHAYALTKVSERVFAEKDARHIRTPADFVKALVREAPGPGAQLQKDLAELSFRLVVNQVRGPEDLATAANVRTVCAKYFGIKIDLLGTVPYDNAVWQAVRAQKPVILAAPESSAAKALRALTSALEGAVHTATATPSPHEQRAPAPREPRYELTP